MPIDPGIIFNLKQPQVADPLQQQAAALNLVGGIQQVKGRQQDLQSGALDLQAKERDIADEKTLRQLAADTNGDLDEIVKRAAGKVSQKRLSALTAAATEHKTKIAALAKTVTDTGKTALEVLKEQNQMVADEAAAVLDAPPDRKQQIYLDARSRLIQKKLIQPNEAPAEYPGDDVMQQFFAVHAGYAKNLEREHKKNEESRAAAGETRAVEAHNAAQAAAGVDLSRKSSDAALARLKLEGQEPMQPADIARLAIEDANQARAVRAEAETKRHNQAVESRMALAAKNGLDSNQNTRVNQIASGFDNEPIVKNYNTISEGVNFAKSLGTGKSANAGDDQALLYSFAKVMDPGSVVREGEYATVQKYSQSWADQFGFKVERIFGNVPFLSDDARAQMKATMEKRAAAAKINYDNVYNEYGRRIEKQAGVKGGTDYLTNYGQAFSGGGVPPAVAELLKGAGAGVHTLSDGSKWAVGADGSVTKQ